ncbi:MAG: putative secreted protein, partial [Verrucomicrobiales bacterium]|nr:putative secreted protein [Verrucomicrobiales bacterium]
RQLGLPWNYRRYVAVYVNGNRRGTLMEDAQTPDADRIKEQFPKDSDGFLYKLQPWFEFDAGGKGFKNMSWCTLNAYTTGGQKKLARYRWNFLNRRSPDSANNYTNVFALIDAANSYRSSSYVSNMESLVDMEEWLRIFAIEHAVGNWDSFGAQNAQNMYGYKPLNGKWTLFIWDYNIVLGNSGSWGPDGGNLFAYNGADPVMGRIYANPTFRRAYLRAFKDIANGPMSNTNANPVLDAKYAAFRANGVTVTAPTAIKSWITTMHNSLLTALSNEGANAPFAVSNGNGADFTTNQNYVVITGTAPVEVKEISIDGSFYPVIWTSVANWTIDYSLHEGTNSLEIAGFDSHGNPVPNATKTIHATYQGQPLDPAVNNVVINEIMYHSPTPGGNYVEIYNRSTDTAFDLSGWQLKGLGFTFENGTVLAPDAYLVVVENLAIFDAIYGADIPVAGEWSGTLNPAGETLELIEPGGAVSAETSIAKVKFESTLPWSQAANGFGSSLQLVDANQSNDRVANWATVSTNSAPQTPQWQHVSITGIATKSILLVGMVTSGDVYIDDLSLVAGSVPETGANNLQNGDLESPLTGPWTVSPNMANSEISTGVSHSGKASLHVVATSGGPTIGAAIWQNTATLQTNATYTLSYWYLPSSNGTSLLIRLSGSSPNSGHIYSLQPFPPPIPSSTLYTPGAINSVRAILPAISPVTLNEIETVNTTGLADHNGTRSPWVELYNPGANTVSLADLYLTDSYTNLNRWSFPSTASLPAGGFSIIWLDGDAAKTTPTELHSSFRPPSGSGSLALVQLLNSAPTVIDYLNYKSLTADQSYGSFPDGSFEGRRVFNNPTPGSKNIGFTPIRVLINEWMAGNSKTIVDPADGSFADWFELYNASNEVADLSGYYLSNSTTNKTQFRIPNSKEITPGGYLLIWADKNTIANTNENDLHVNFKLAKSGDTIALFDPIGTLIDAVSFGVQSDDISQGRLPDGAGGEFSSFSVSTPGASNSTSGAEYIMVAATIQAGAIVLNWNSQPGKVYEVQSKESLSDSTWQSLPPILAVTSITTVTNQAGSGAERFFRIARINQ